MKERETKNIFSLTPVVLLIKFVVIFIFLSGSSFGADAPNSDKSSSKDTAKYQGAVFGKWSGESMGFVVNGTFSINISADGIVSGTFSGTQSGTITGTVSSSGEINAQGSAGITEWKGQASISNGRMEGSGTWTGYGITGSWGTD
jgi:hypothetical protein